MVKFVLTKLVVAKGKEAEFEENQKARFSSSNAKGSLGYALLRSEEDPSVYYQIAFWETKKDREALAKVHGPIGKLKSKPTSNPVINKPKAQWFDVVARKETGVLKFYGSASKQKR